MKTLEDYVWVAPAYSYSFCDKVINSSNNNSWDNHFWINRDKKESFSYPEKELKIQKNIQMDYSRFLLRTSTCSKGSGGVGWG